MALDLATKFDIISSALLEPTSFLGYSIVAFAIFPLSFWIYYETKDFIHTALITMFLGSMYFSWILDNNPVLILLLASFVTYMVGKQILKKS